MVPDSLPTCTSSAIGLFRASTQDNLCDQALLSWPASSHE